MYGNVNEYAIAQLKHLDKYDLLAALHRQGERIYDVKDAECFDVYENTLEAEFEVDIKLQKHSRWTRYRITVCIEEGKFVGYLDWTFEDYEKQLEAEFEQRARG